MKKRRSLPKKLPHGTSSTPWGLPSVRAIDIIGENCKVIFNLEQPSIISLSVSISPFPIVAI
mgnify:CR=1 FL=1